MMLFQFQYVLYNFLNKIQKLLQFHPCHLSAKIICKKNRYMFFSNLSRFAIFKMADLSDISDSVEKLRVARHGLGSQGRKVSEMDRFSALYI
jgi:hypothetical protein